MSDSSLLIGSLQHSLDGNSVHFPVAAIFVANTGDHLCKLGSKNIGRLKFPKCSKKARKRQSLTDNVDLQFFLSVKAKDSKNYFALFRQGQLLVVMFIAKLN